MNPLLYPNAYSKDYEDGLIRRSLREAEARVRELEEKLDAQGLDAEHPENLRDRDDLTDDQQDLVYMLLKAKHVVEELEHALREDQTPSYESHLQACNR